MFRGVLQSFCCNHLSLASWRPCRTKDFWNYKLAASPWPVNRLETKVGFMKTFSLDEAQSLLPILESLLRRAIDAKASAGLVEVELQMLSRNIFLSGGMLVDVAAVARKRVAQRASVQQAQDAIQEIDSIGVQVKDLDKGLLDFPYQVGEQIVLLCWQLGEAKIDYWHTVEAGFQGRQPLDERFIKTRPERPN
jgi:hypothetical protein